MTEKYKVGDLFKCENQNDKDGKKCTDFAEVISISSSNVCYKWMGIGNAEQYVFSLGVESFEHTVEMGNYQLIPCDSEQQKLAILLKHY